MSTISERIKMVREDTGETTRQFAKTLDYDDSNYRKVERGEIALPASKYGVIITQYGVNLNWLVTGVGERYLPGFPTAESTKQANEEAQNVAVEEDIRKESTSQVLPAMQWQVGESDTVNYGPLVETAESKEARLNIARKALREVEMFYRDPGTPNVFDLESEAAAGRAIMLLEQDKTMLKPNLYLPGLGPGIHIRMPARGNSMHPTIWDGDKVVGTWVPDGYKDIKNDHVYIVLDTDDDVVVKRLALEPTNRLQLTSDNEQVQDPYLRRLEDIRAIFRVRQIHRFDLRKDVPDVLAEMGKLRKEWATFKANFFSESSETQTT